MIPNTSFAVSSVQVSQLPIQVSQIEGYFKGAALAWLQVHDSCIAPAVGAVPLWQMPVQATAQFQETLQVARLNLTEGLFVGLSSTEGTYTASASTMDVTVWTDVTPLATNAVGDKTTQATNLQVWSQATGAASAKKLYQLIVTELTGNNSFILIYAVDDPNVQLPGNPTNYGLVLVQYPLPAYATVKLRFGGSLPNLETTKLGTAVPQQGCTVYVGYEATVDGVNYGIPNYQGTPVFENEAAILAITN